MGASKRQFQTRFTGPSVKLCPSLVNAPCGVALSPRGHCEGKVATLLHLLSDYAYFTVLNVFESHRLWILC